MSPTATQDYISDSRRIRQSLRVGEILVVDDDLSVLDFMGNLCRTLGEKCVKFKTIENAKLCILMSYASIKMAIIDYKLEGEPADELIEMCREFHIPCVIHTGCSQFIEKLEHQYPDITVVLKSSPIERLIKEMI
jgi:DNA-binding NtrC family response regulator